MSEGSIAAQMPRYRCHKEVWALNILHIELVKGGAMIFPEDAGYAPFRVDEGYITKHNPKDGGYYVVYKDGYKSFSPAEAFEEGYTRV